MTEISFYFNVPSRAGYACRLLRKARRQGLGLTVVGPRDALLGLDNDLWAFDPAEFLPHDWVEHAGRVPERLRQGTVWLADHGLQAPVHDALLNLGDSAPSGYETFARLLEVVSTDEADRAAARERWKGYARRGYPIRKYEVGAS
ncbi:MAG TPA: DNA polymerase III subunit chi [Caldimonas sp.]|jgi:DNA polymerase-3 subunit chi|nr:DNA polymerase III subunit chi [Caldimonas sp.]HEX2541486.1 DNA polymerase III subunit chi [Caldimonas sp.]